MLEPFYRVHTGRTAIRPSIIPNCLHSFCQQQPVAAGMLHQLTLCSPVSVASWSAINSRFASVMPASGKDSQSCTAAGPIAEQARWSRTKHAGNGAPNLVSWFAPQGRWSKRNQVVPDHAFGSVSRTHVVISAGSDICSSCKPQAEANLSLKSRHSCSAYRNATAEKCLPAAAEVPVCGLSIAQFAKPCHHRSNRMRKSTGQHALSHWP